MAVLVQSWNRQHAEELGDQLKMAAQERRVDDVTRILAASEAHMLRSTDLQETLHLAQRNQWTRIIQDLKETLVARGILVTDPLR